MNETEKTYVGCVTLSRELFPVSFPRFQEVAQFMNAILGTMAGLKYKVRHENRLFGLRMLFSFCFGWGGVGAKGV